MLNVVEKQPGNKDLFRHHSPEMKASIWVDEQLAAAQRSGIVCCVGDITPALARILLTKNEANRRVSDVVVEKIARDIENGTFVLNGESIIVASDGSLNDGQHRLCAVISADKEIRSVIVFGPGRQSRITVDQGRSKLVGDYLAMEGHKDSLALAAAAGYFWQWRNKGRLTKQSIERPNKGEVLAIVDEHPGIAESVAAIGGNGVGGRGLLAFCHFAFTSASNREAADLFADALITGASLMPRDPILYARNRLMADRRLSPNEKAELLFRAWNAHRRGEAPKTLTVNDQALPKVER